MPKEIKMFACIYCSKKLLKTEKGMLAHENVCYKNPENYYPCWGCEHKTIIEISHTYCGEEATSEVHYCSERRIQIHNKVCEKRGLDESGRFLKSALVQKCELFEIKNSF